MPDTFGLILRQPFAVLDPSSQFWRTSEGIFPSDWIPFSGTWPASGMTRNGCAFARPMLAHLTNGKGSSVLPTPRTSRGASGTETIYALGGT